MKKGIKAWLVSWEWVGHHRKPDVQFVYVLNPRWASTRVRDVMEVVYANSEERSFYQRIDYLKKPKEIRLKIQNLGNRITVGSNPWLYGRVVNNLCVERTADASRLLWTEPRKEIYDKTTQKWKFVTPEIEADFPLED